MKDKIYYRKRVDYYLYFVLVGLFLFVFQKEIKFFDAKWLGVFEILYGTTSSLYCFYKYKTFTESKDVAESKQHDKLRKNIFKNTVNKYSYNNTKMYGDGRKRQIIDKIKYIDKK
jgi:hypothetical protein